MVVADGNHVTARSDAALDAVRSKIRRIPIPAAPPRYPSWGTAVGVNFLDAALNQNHIVRRSERLTVPDRTHLSRTIAVRISLDRLTPTQAAAGLRYGRLSEGASHRSLASRFDDVDGRSPLVWVPITRLAREWSAPVQIYDNEGRELPRATQPELLPFVNAALYSLMKVVLRANLHAQRQGTKLFKFLFDTNRARWLLEKSIASLVYEQHRVVVADAYQDRESSTEAEDHVRNLALEVVDEYLQTEIALLELLHHAATEHLIVAGLLASKREHYLTYDAPPLAAVGRSSSRDRLIRMGRALLPTGRTFNLRYNTHLPPSLDSVHFSLELDPRIRVRDAFLVTDSDDPRCSQLSDNLRELDRTGMRAYTKAYLDNETASVLSDVQELANGREIDWVSYRDRWDTIREVDGRRRLNWRMPNRRLLKLIQRLDDVRRKQKQWNSSDVGRSEDLIQLADQVDALKLGHDVTVSDDPRRNGAHMYRRQGIHWSTPTQPRTAAAWLHATLTDEPTSLLGSVPSWLGALLILVIALGVAFFRSLRYLEPWSHVAVQADVDAIQADAVVAIMLIVPSLLLKRVDLPGAMTFAGRLRVLDRTAAFVAIAVTGALAVVIATELSSDWAMRIAFFWVSLILFSLLIITAADIASTRVRARRPSVDSLDAPLWLTPDGERQRVRYDVVFDTRGTGNPAPPKRASEKGDI